MATTLLGLVEMQAALVTVQRGLALKIDSALKLEAEAIMSASRLRVPVDTGVLRSSAVTGDPITTGLVHTIEMGYGGAASEYAAIVHERLDVHHNAPTGAKYLEGPLREAAPHLLGNIATRIAFDKP